MKTLEWWGKQSKEIQEEAFREDTKRVNCDEFGKTN